MYRLVFRQSVALYPSVLDVGCGRQSEVTKVFRRNNDSDPRRFIVGLDLHAPYLREAKRREVYDDLIMADARFIPFRPRSFDVILLFEVIEHLNREEGEAVLETLEKIARRQIAVTTPNGPFPQGVVDNNKWQIHKSAWRSEDFERRGYVVVGFPGSFDKSQTSSLGVFRFFNYVAGLLTWILQPFPLKNNRVKARIFCMRSLTEDDHETVYSGIKLTGLTPQEFCEESSSLTGSSANKSSTLSVGYLDPNARPQLGRRLETLPCERLPRTESCRHRGVQHLF